MEYTNGSKGGRIPSHSSMPGARKPREEGPGVLRVGTIKIQTDGGEDPAKLRTQQFEDLFADQYGAGGAFAPIEPPYPIDSLTLLPQENDTLLQCLHCMSTNIEKTGHVLEYIGEDPEAEESRESVEEKERISNILNQPNAAQSLQDLRHEWRLDLETYGFAFLEVIRSKDESTSMVFHVPAFSMRLTKMDEEPTEIVVFLKRGGKVVEQPLLRRFRRFVQLTTGGRKKFFKEWGDPRNIDSSSGEVIESENPGEDIELATEVHFSRIYAPGEVYGVPRYINNIPAILGSRESELTNYDFFRNNTIPPMAVLVSGGGLTRDACREIEEKLTTKRGRDGVHDVVVIEAVGDESAAGGIDNAIPVPKLELKPLLSERQGDALFQQYEANNARKIRSSFRIPGLLLGRTDESYNRATAETAVDMADEQVFGPERTTVDRMFNQILLLLEGRPPVYWNIRSNPPKLINHELTIRAVGAFAATGALTPNIARDILNSILDLKIPPIEEPWGDEPWTGSTAEEPEAEAEGVPIGVVEEEALSEEAVEAVAKSILRNPPRALHDPRMEILVKAASVYSRRTRRIKFDPNQPRDNRGRWTSSGGMSYVASTNTEVGEAVQKAADSWQELTGDVYDNPDFPMDRDKLRKNWSNKDYEAHVITRKEDEEFFASVDVAVREQYLENDKFRSIVESSGGQAVAVYKGEGLTWKDFHKGSTSLARSGGFVTEINYAMRKWIGPETKPEPGDFAVGEDLGTVLRHEYGHTLWNQKFTVTQRKAFFNRVEDASVISKYAASLSQEVFPEALTLVTHPQYNRDDYPEWVGKLDDWMMEELTK